MASRADQLASNLNFSKFGKATELKNRIWFTIGALIVFRMLSYVPLPGIDPTALGLLSQQTRGGVLDFFNTFSGGSLSRMSLIALGVMPYITASIVVQLSTSLSPQHYYQRYRASPYPQKLLCLAKLDCRAKSAPSIALASTISFGTPA